ncbi:MAG: glycoside hydrolase domain-containing protein [Luteimonas sp.]
MKIQSKAKGARALAMHPITAALTLIVSVAGLAYAASPAELAQAAGTTALNVESMQLLTASSGWAADQKHVLWTDDSGQRWQDITPASLEGHSIQSVFFMDANHGWVASKADTSGELAVSITRNGGASWTRTSLAAFGVDGTPTSIDFVDALNGWMMVRLPSSANFSIGTLLRTRDGGQTWSRLSAPPIASAVNFTSLRTGWLAGGPAGDQLYVTHDGGQRWQRQFVSPHSAADQATAPIYQAPVFRNDREGTLPMLFSGSKDSVLATYETVDGGAHWSIKRSIRLAGDVERDGGVVASVLDADTVVVAPNNRRGLSVLSQGQQRDAGLPAQLATQQAITAMDFSNASQGWMTVASGHCAQDKSDCHQERRLLVTADGGRTTRDITPSVTATPSTNVGVNRVTASTGLGFDKCAIGSVSQMQAWFTNTPWSDANVYIGGSNRGCGQAGLGSGWVNSIFNQGWRLIPTWVGPQAPGSVCRTCGIMSTNTTTARQQGINEANAAADTAANLGLPAPTIIYYDMERYDPTSHPAVRAFVNAWVERLRQRGHQAGVYGAGVNAANDWAPIANPPNAVWIAAWNNNQSVFGLPGLPDSQWNNHQRIHQFRGDHDETWGGVTFNIDSNRADGPVADN